jgi:hypothetical protein
MNRWECRFACSSWVACLLALGGLAAPGFSADAGVRPDFNRDIQPLLAKYCYDCHADGENKGDVALDSFKTDPAFLNDHAVWWKVLKNVRGGIMPPPRKPQPSADEKVLLANWIKYGALGIDPRAPDPGRVTIRRLNREEYRNTIRDLMGVDYNTNDEFPPDDTGYGFDTIGDVLSISPMLLEKYMKAAETIVQSSVPTAAVPVTVQAGDDLQKDGGAAPDQLARRFFPRDDVPKDDTQRREYARQVLAAFAAKAFRRPADDRTVERLVRIAESVYAKPDKRFEQGIAQAIVAVISSPRFLFRIEKAEPGHAAEAFSPIDEYSLASRLSYFLWSTMPDDQLISLAQRGELRKNFAGQVKRLMADPRSAAMIRNFAGQWLQLRDMDGISIDARVVLARDNGTEKELQAQIARFRAIQEQAAALSQERGPASASAAAAANDALNALRKRPQPAVQLDDNLRTAMRLEPELLFESIIRENKSLADLLDCNYTFLNARLAKVYGISGVTGNQMRRVELPSDSPRGGLLTMGSLLVVTSNPTRTSPVKRGLFILDNILGMSVPPPPADVPALEASEKALDGGREPTLREVLETHRSNALCSSCHSHMDPLGLSLENFNALGMFREKERGQSIDASGKLVTGETFHDARDLKQILRKNHTQDFYRCLTEKLLTYALGRGLDYYDIEAVDQIVAEMQKQDGRFPALLMGVVESAPFQERRNLPAAPAPVPSTGPAVGAGQHTQVQ